MTDAPAEGLLGEHWQERQALLVERSSVWQQIELTTERIKETTGMTRRALVLERRAMLQYLARIQTAINDNDAERERLVEAYTH